MDLVKDRYLFDWLISGYDSHLRRKVYRVSLYKLGERDNDI